MSSLISTVEKDELEIIFRDIFDTFKRTITVHKEPKKIITDLNVDFLFGYGESAQNQNIEYIPESKEFFATISYSFSPSDSTYVQDLNSYLPGTVVKIKVEKETKDYINTSKTEFIEFDGHKFNLVTSDIENNFLGVHFYIYFLKVVN